MTALLHMHPVFYIQHPSNKVFKCSYSSILRFWCIIQNNNVQQVEKKRTKHWGLLKQYQLSVFWPTQAYGVSLLLLVSTFIWSRFWKQWRIHMCRLTKLISNDEYISPIASLRSLCYTSRKDLDQKSNSLVLVAIVTLCCTDESSA